MGGGVRASALSLCRFCHEAVERRENRGCVDFSLKQNVFTVFTEFLQNAKPSVG